MVASRRTKSATENRVVYVYKMSVTGKFATIINRFALSIDESSHFSGPWFNINHSNPISCMYPFGICNNFIKSDSLDNLNKSPGFEILDFNWQNPKNWV
jgi:hypothetical protein